MRLGGTWAVLALAGALAACGAPSSAPTVASGDSGGVASALTGFVGYDKLRPEQVEESSFVSDGDEPYVAVLRIRSTTGVKGSTKWAWVSDNPQETGSVKNGNEATIPDGTGDAWFDGALAVRPLEQTQ